MIKNSDEYDSILHVGADMNFMCQYFNVNLNNMSNAKLQLIELYTKEYEENLKKSKTLREENLASLLHNRNLCLIERTYMSYRIKEIDRKNIGLTMLTSEDASDKAESLCAYAENDLYLNQRQIRLLRVASNTEGLIWGEERSVADYQAELETRYQKDEFGKISIIEDLKANLEIAQAQLKALEEHLQDQKNDELKI